MCMVILLCKILNEKKYYVLRLLWCFRTNSVQKGYTWLYLLILRTGWCCFGVFDWDLTDDFPWDGHNLTAIKPSSSKVTIFGWCPVHLTMKSGKLQRQLFKYIFMFTIIYKMFTPRYVPAYQQFDPKRTFLGHPKRWGMMIPTWQMMNFQNHRLGPSGGYFFALKCPIQHHG